MLKEGWFYLYRDSAKYKWPVLQAGPDGKYPTFEGFIRNQLDPALCVCKLKKVSQLVTMYGNIQQEITFEILKSDVNYSPYLVGDILNATVDDLGVKQHLIAIADENSVLAYEGPDSIPISASSGAICGGCHQLYPYAINAPGFKCWACTNGY